MIDRILVDCSDMYCKPWINTGIQRVVKNVISNLDQAPDNVESLAVIIEKDQLYAVETAAIPNNSYAVLIYIERYLLKVIHAGWSRYRVNKDSYFHFSLNTRPPIWIIYRLFSSVLSLLLAIVRFLRQKFRGPLVQIETRKGDVFLMIDASWNEFDYGVYNQISNTGCQLVAVVHDVIPLSAPQFFADNLVDNFNHWFSWLIANVDGIVGVSQHTANEVQKYIERMDFGNNQPWVDFAYNGEGLPVAPLASSLPNKLTSFLAKNPGKCYLCVGTIEPRKNHKYILDAFQLAWDNGSDAKLIFIGKQGWHCDDIIARITSNAALGKQLIWMKNVSDDQLNMLYSSIDAVILASFDEGFGLPIVESLCRGKPVFASDIAVFREFGNDGLRFFDLSNAQELADLVSTDIGVEVPDNWSWYTWQESTDLLFKKIMQKCNF
jgi:glycosyltransferase involved in cell wall biosynthesis